MLLAKQEALEAGEAFFQQTPCDDAAALQWSAAIRECTRGLPHGIGLLVGCNGFVARVADTGAEELAGLIGAARLPRALSVAQLMHRIAGEVKRRDYLLDELADELGRMPASCSSADEELSALIGLQQGFRLRVCRPNRQAAGQYSTLRTRRSCRSNTCSATSRRLRHC
jgi:hypothetical protein